MPDPKAPTGREDTRLATPREELERQITSWTVPKNEREWWACREIERLRAEVERLTERATDAESDALRLHHEKMDWFEEHATATTRIAELEAEVERWKEAVNTALKGRRVGGSGITAPDGTDCPYIDYGRGCVVIWRGYVLPVEHDGDVDFSLVTPPQPEGKG